MTETSRGGNSRIYSIMKTNSCFQSQITPDLSLFQRGKQLNSSTAALPYGKCSFYSINFLWLRLITQVVSALSYQTLLAKLPSPQRQKETKKTRKSKDLTSGRQLANTGWYSLTRSSRLKSTAKGNKQINWVFAGHVFIHKTQHQEGNVSKHIHSFCLRKPGFPLPSF